MTLSAALSLALLACASQSKLNEAELAQLVDWYPGRYSNADQPHDGAGTGHPTRAALDINIARIYAPSIGQHVFYVQETAADDSRRIVSQRLVAFEAVKDRGVVQTLWSLAEPVRWRDAHLSPDLFKSLQPQDFAPLRGCELTWTRKTDRFTGTNDSSTCRTTSPATGGTVRMELRGELSPDELAWAELSYDVAGRLVQGNAAEPFYRFSRR